MSDDVHHSNMVSFRRYNLRFCIRNRVFAPFWPGRHWNFRAFWNFSDQLGAEHFCVFFLRVINRSALKNVGISILLRLFMTDVLIWPVGFARSEVHTSDLQSHSENS